MAASPCRAVGLDELVTSSVADDEATALALAVDRARLSALRGRLAGALPESPLFDTCRFALDLERLYITMQERRLTGLAPTHLS